MFQDRQQPRFMEKQEAELSFFIDYRSGIYGRR